MTNHSHTSGPADTTTAELARRFVTAFNARDTQTLRRLYHPDARIKRPTWPTEADVETALSSIQLDFGAYPDGHLHVRQVIVQDRAATVEFHFEGTNTQPLTLFSGQEIPATGRPLRLGGTIILHIDEHGLITAERQYWQIYPLLEFWTAVGVIRSSSPTRPSGVPE